MNSHECVEEYQPNITFERIGRVATVLAGLAITAYALHEKDVVVGAVGLGIAIPAGINTIVSEL